MAKVIWDTNNLVGEMYSIMSKLKDNFDIQEEYTDFDEYIIVKLSETSKEAKEWLADDEVESKEV